jgi:predicted metal-dependent hydrolase
MFGYKLVKYGNHSFKFAEIEKLLLDYFYLNSQLKTKDDFFEMRFNEKEFKDKVNKKTLLYYLEKFNNKSLEKRVEKFLKFINL